MADILSPAILLALVPLSFAVAGGKLAYNRGKNPLLWGIASAFFPICIMIVWFEKPLKEVQGQFKRCPACGEWLKWAEDPCRYCATGFKQGP